MPGFKIGGEGDGPNSTSEIHRVHRFKLETFLGNPGDKEPFDMLKDVDMPERMIEELQVKTPGGTYKFGKQASYGDVKFAFYMPKELASKLEELLDKVHDIKTGIKDFDNYMDKITLVMQHKEKDIKITFENAWIGSISYGQLSYGSSDLQLVNVTVKFSWYIKE